jgi:hypothetical protein
MRFFDFDARKPASALARATRTPSPIASGSVPASASTSAMKVSRCCSVPPAGAAEGVNLFGGSQLRKRRSVMRELTPRPLRAAKEVCAWRRVRRDGWYTKLAVDRLLSDKLQTLLDPQYRQSFRRAEDRAKKQGGGYWWGPGENRPFP